MRGQVEQREFNALSQGKTDDQKIREVEMKRKCTEDFNLQQRVLVLIQRNVVSEEVVIPEQLIQ